MCLPAYFLGRPEKRWKPGLKDWGQTPCAIVKNGAYYRTESFLVV